MPRYALRIEYRGDSFAGWQIQPEGARTVQGSLSDALFTLTRERVNPRGSGRTDAGVHAEGQVASVSLGSEWASDRIQRALNGLLPRDIVVLSVAEVAESFDAMRDAIGKAYRYQIWNCTERSPLLAARFVHVPGSLDVGAMQAASAHLLGEHDFRSFQAAGSSVKTTVRTLNTLKVRPEPGGELFVEAEGSGFLRHMVRNIVGTLLEVGAGRRSPESMESLLRRCDRRLAGPTAPAHGLTLERVFYAEDPFENARESASSGDSKGKASSSKEART
ncbi:MAG: tRNA pseudouridine(38-40) synthase TruA [Deltaproteobacteria bacterium]|nr:tRNA pseudouridine(38-40) synthase TruA [Deltaproteobacteria bacterium]